MRITQSCPAHYDPMVVAHQAPLCMISSRQECWSGLPFRSPGDCPKPGIEPALKVLHCRQILYCLSHQGSPSNWPELAELGCELGPMCFQSLDFFHNTILSSLSNTSEAILSFHPAITALDHKRTNVTRSSLEGIRLFAWKCLSHTPKHTTTTAGSARASIQHKLAGLLQ